MHFHAGENSHVIIDGAFAFSSQYTLNCLKKGGFEVPYISIGMKQ